MYGVNKVFENYVRTDYHEHLSEFEYQLDCSLGTNPYGKSAGLEELSLLQHIDKYPEGDEKLLEAIGSYFSSSMELSPEMIGLSVGSIGAILSLNRMFLKPGKVILGVAPQFSAVIDDFNLYEASYLPVYLKKENRFRFSLADFMTGLKEAGEAYVYIDNPNNPTGQIIPKSDLEKIIAAAQKNNSFVIIDEAYGDYMDLSDSAADLIEKYDNLAVVRTFSKGLGAAGIRLGYVISNPHIISIYNKVNVPYAKNSMAGAVAQAVINSGWAETWRETIIAGKQRLLASLSVIKAASTSDNVPISLLYVDDTTIDLAAVMEQAGLKVVPCEGYQGLGKNYIRINLNKDLELMLSLLKDTEALILKQASAAAPSNGSDPDAA